MATTTNGQLYPDYDDHFHIIDHAGGMRFRMVPYDKVMDVLKGKVYEGAPQEVIDYLDDKFEFPGYDDYLDLTVDWEDDLSALDDLRVRATIYSYFDDDTSMWRHGFDRWDRTPDETHDVLLPKGFDLYVTESGETFAYRTATEPHDLNVRHDTWKVVARKDGTFAIVDATNGTSDYFRCKSV